MKCAVQKFRGQHHQHGAPRAMAAGAVDRSTPPAGSGRALAGGPMPRRRGQHHQPGGGRHCLGARTPEPHDAFYTAPEIVPCFLSPCPPTPSGARLALALALRERTRRNLDFLLGLLVNEGAESREPQRALAVGPGFGACPDGVDHAGRERQGLRARGYGRRRLLPSAGSWPWTVIVTCPNGACALCGAPSLWPPFSACDAGLSPTRHVPLCQTPSLRPAGLSSSSRTTRRSQLSTRRCASSWHPRRLPNEYSWASSPSTRRRNRLPSS